MKYYIRIMPSYYAHHSGFDRGLAEPQLFLDSMN